jgi:hypothetical protein
MKRFLLFFSLILSLTFFACQKDPSPDVNHVCDGRWDCDWTYQMFCKTYGPADSVKIDTLPMSGTIDIEAYWPCYQLVDQEWEPYTWLYTQFQNNNLVAFIFVDSI